MWSALRSCLSVYLDLSPLGIGISLAACGANSGFGGRFQRRSSSARGARRPSREHPQRPGVRRISGRCRPQQNDARFSMAAAAKTQSSTTRKTSGRRRRTGRRDPLAITLLKKDHREVEGWFDEYEQLEDDAEKLALFNKIALALKVHTTIEEEIFYPEERGDVEEDM